MLLSLINKIFIKPSHRLGIAIGRIGICVASDTNAQIRLYEASFSQAIYGNNSTSDFSDELSNTLKSVNFDTKQNTIEVNVVVPDTILRSSVLEFDSLPGNQKSFNDLIKWKMAELLGRDENLLECRAQYIGNDRNHKIVYAQAAESAWLESVRTATDAAEIHAWKINSASHYYYNALASKRSLKSSALLCIEPDYWTLQLCDNDGRLHRIVTRLSRVTDDASEISYIADEVIHAVNSSEHSKHLSIKSIHVCGVHDLSTNIAAELSSNSNDISIYANAKAISQNRVFADSHQLANLALIAIQ